MLAIRSLQVSRLQGTRSSFSIQLRQFSLSVTMHRSPAAMVARPIPDDISVNVPRDPNTLSNYNNWKTKHTAVDLRVDFEKKSLSGNVTLDLKSITEGETAEIILDTSYLKVSDVKADGKSVKWTLADRFEPFGSPLSIKLESALKRAEMVKLEIAVSTTEECTALQWLKPAQTSNGKHMFSQCQAIHARSIFPCQDTPDIKSPFYFKIQSALPVVASGLPDGVEDVPGGKEKIYKFLQDVPLPSYLFAVASGDIVSAPIGPRSEVWTGPKELAACKWELEEDTENFLKILDELVYPYAWGQYNVLVLPPSFPYGGMENPMYTFATPTIISGDRQNVDVIAHEISHSWSGNLVSPASWEHFWLNEGWTTYLERRIQRALRGDKGRDFSSIIGWKALQDSIENFGEDHQFTKLIPDLKGIDPDDAFSTIPYEKGFTFLFYLEKLIGIEKWDEFIPHYFKTFKYASLDSYDFRTTVLDFFGKDEKATAALKDVDWDKWFYGTGFPPKPDFDTSMVDVCYDLAEKWNKLSDSPSSDFKPSPDDIKGWTANQLVVFLQTLPNRPKPLDTSLIPLMGKTYGFAKSQNVEVSSQYFVLGLKAGSKDVLKPTAELLGKVGRMKFVRPLFRNLKLVDEKLAKETFEKNKDFYHSVCRKMVEKDLFG